jgi:transcriptional regulator of acetoin/glycerol metabolism
VLERTQNNVTRAAAIAEVSRQMVQRLMRKHGL